ncbi:metallophosphoesterase [Blastococcus sp. CCUG 61487]|uniref:metallophosphoesterase n=1 Tax=Blastococcus sp. CCUG 61487 TaxID=1840703 RepID=UPI0010C00632|nr:metallophosphoesterase [Blastococcus sp. CCUG 61487]
MSGASVQESEPDVEATSPWRRRGRVAGLWLARIGLALVGALVAVLLFARISAPIGPFDASLAIRPGSGGAEVAVPPLGSLAVDVFDGPLRLDVQLQRVDQVRAQELANDPVRLAGVVDRVTEDLQGAVVKLVVITVLVALAGAALVSWLVIRRRREPLIAAGLTGILLLGIGGVGAATWRPEAMATPTYTGLLVNANSLIGNAQDIAARFDAYRASLEDLVANVGSLYSTLSALPAPGIADRTVTLLHVSDIHLNPAGFDLVQQVVSQFQVDGVLDTGDITDWGSSPENTLISSVGTLDVPYVFIRGNHDSAATAERIAAQPNTTVLDDSATEIGGLTIVGARDPRFTPDKSTGDDDAGPEVLVASGERLAEFVETLDVLPDVALVHDPKQAPPLDGEVPLILAGHTHNRAVSELDGGTLLMVQGSTGGAGLRALQGEYPEPLTCTVLYFDAETGDLRAYDEITLGGLGEAEVMIERIVVPPDADEDEDGGEQDGDEDDGGS